VKEERANLDTAIEEERRKHEAAVEAAVMEERRKHEAAVEQTKRERDMRWKLS
jgi:hypothetical protein